MSIADPVEPQADRKHRSLLRSPRGFNSFPGSAVDATTLAGAGT
jgi:hypothetical protein